MTKCAVLLLLMGTAALLPAQEQVRIGGGGHAVGAEHREIAPSSPVAKAVVEETPVGARLTPFKIAVKVIVTNTSSDDLQAPSADLDVYSSTTGMRAPEGSYGCNRHFWSDCYIHPFPIGVPSGGIKPILIPPGGKYEDQLLVDGEYQLEPRAKYNIVAIICGMGKGPECFKSAPLTITVPDDFRQQMF